MNQSFAEMIREAREKAGLSQRKLAKLVNVNYSYISKMESDTSDYPPSEKVLRDIAFHLNLDIYQLRYASSRFTQEETQLLKSLGLQWGDRFPDLIRLLQENPHTVRMLLEGK